MAITVERWQLIDPDGSTPTWTFPHNPSTMTEVFPRRNITGESTAALTGQALYWEGAWTPYEWSFGGDVLSYSHYEGLRWWFYAGPATFNIKDHFGRIIPVAPLHFKPIPKTSLGKYWRHTYDCDVMVLGRPSIPTVGEKWA